ncbi:MAG: hypothetical protein AAB563_03160 [Patescibacteria group bacterium]
MEKQIFVTVPEGLLVEERQLNDAIKDISGVLAKFAVTPEEYQFLRESSRVIQGKAGYLKGIELGIAQLRSITPCIFLPKLPDAGFAKANTSLEYSWNRNSESTRLERIETQYGAFKRLTELDVKKHDVVGLPGWESDFVVSTPEALVWAGIDPEEFLKQDVKKMSQKAVEGYSTLLRHLSDIPGLHLGDFYRGCIEKDGALPHPDCIRTWMKLPSAQTTGGALTVHQMPVNPAIWFQVDETPYSIAPRHVPGIINDLPVGNRVRKVAIGDMVTVATFMNMNPFVVKEIAAGTGRRIDISGTLLRNGNGCSVFPYVFQYDDEAWLSGLRTDFAGSDFGSFVVAWE